MITQAHPGTCEAPVPAAIAPPPAPVPLANPPSLAALFFSFLRLGVTCFGGPAMVAYIREMVVIRKRWLTEDVMDDGIVLAQSLPGVIAMDTAAYVGLRLRGIRGAIAAYVGFTLPAFLLMLALTAAYVASRSVPRIVALMTGLQVLVVAIVANATWSFLRKVAADRKALLLAAACGALLIAEASPFLVITGAAFAGMFLLTNGAVPQNGSTAAGSVRSHWGPTLCLAGVALAGLIALYVWDRPAFSLATLMVEINLFSFGGGYTALPLMLHQVVTVHRWLDYKTLMDGVALGQVTPGPISITATFIGYMLLRLRGAIIATIAIYTPCFLLVLATVPYYDKLKRSRHFAHASRGIAASFVGLLIFATVKFGSAIAWTPTKAVLVLAAFLALLRKLDIAYVVLIGAAVSIFIF